MPKLINQPIKPVTLTEDFSIFLDKYSTFDKFVAEATDNREEAEKAKVDETLSQLEEEIHNNNLIVVEQDSEGFSVNIDNLMEWLRLYYEVESK